MNSDPILTRHLCTYGVNRVREFSGAELLKAQCDRPMPTPAEIEEAEKREKEHRRMTVATAIVGLAEKILVENQYDPETSFRVAKDMVRRSLDILDNYQIPEDVKTSERKE